MSAPLHKVITKILVPAGVALAGSVLLAPMALAQAPTREEIQRDRLDQQLRQRGQALSIEGQVERAPCPLANPDFADLRFTLREAQFSGLDSLPAGVVDDAWRGQVGQELPVAAVCEIRDRAATALRQAGYLAAVQVPAQTIGDGVVRFDVILARMTGVQVRGDPGPSGGQLQKYLDKLAGQPVFNIQDAERYLLLARDIPGLDVRLTLQPAPRGAGAQPGEVIGVFNVQRTAFYLDASVQNYGSRSVGRFGGMLRARFNGLTGAGDETTLSAYTTAEFKEQQVIQASHEFRVGGEGLTLGLDGTYAWSKPDVPGPNLFDSETLIASIRATYPFVRSQAFNLYGSAGFDLIDQDTDFSGLPLSTDSLRVGWIRADLSVIDEDSILGRDGYSAAEPRLAFGASLEARQGLSVFGASEGCGVAFVNCTAPGAIPPSRFDGDPTSFILRGEAQMDWRPTPLVKFTLRPRFQYSGDALFSYEQFSGGNYTVGRGYDPGTVIGDSGIGIQGEIAYGSLIPDEGRAIAWQPYAFVDHIRVWTKNIPGDPQTLTSAGAGLRATIGRRAYLDVTGTVPLERPPFALTRGDARLLATLTVQLAPNNR
ncbi:MAG: ShlB/FhaC/HecB family hemolysin secretion/activation protein [Sphingomonadaceae bacterium]|nr:ShlB/FhaC/HecB family hemolysin secretion/activation protein [Sphingomonadaceae bacterium]